MGDENMPKRALSAYMLFAADERPKSALDNEDKKITEVMSLVAKAWKDLGEAEKKPYNDKAKKLADKHDKAVETYKKSKKHLEYLEAKKAYLEGMEAKRKRLMKQAGMEVAVGKGSSGTPTSKRVKKTSEPKKKASGSKKSSTKKKSNPKKSRSKKKKSS